jgi:hypothetical protein
MESEMEGLIKNKTRAVLKERRGQVFSFLNEVRFALRCGLTNT